MLSKIPELADTGFLIARGRPVGLLHWFHHATVLLYCWFAYSARSSSGLFFCAMNYLVHSVMYAYFAAVAAGYKPSWGAHVTRLQIAQMVAGVAIVASSAWLQLALGRSCEEPVVLGRLVGAVGSEGTLVERSLPRPPRVAGEDRLRDKRRQELLEGDVGGRKPFDERRALGFEAFDPRLVIGAARQAHELLRDQERRVGRRLDPLEPRKHRAAEHAPEWLGIGRPIDLLVADRVDVAAAALDEERDRIPSEGLFDDPRGDGGEIGRCAAARWIHDRMASEEIDDGER